MTNEKRCFIEPSDIVGLELECPNCGTQTCYKMDGNINPVSACPNCKAKFYDQPSHEEELLRAYIQALKGGWMRNGMRVNIRLRLSAPKEDN